MNPKERHLVSCLAQMHGLYSLLQQGAKPCILPLTGSISFDLSCHNLCILVSNHLDLTIHDLFCAIIGEECFWNH